MGAGLASRGAEAEWPGADVGKPDEDSAIPDALNWTPCPIPWELWLQGY